MPKKSPSTSDLLTQAICDGDIAEVKRLLIDGADPNQIADNKEIGMGMSPLSLAIRAWNNATNDIMGLLIEHGADINKLVISPRVDCGTRPNVTLISFSERHRTDNANYNPSDISITVGFMCANNKKDKSLFEYSFSSAQTREGHGAAKLLVSNGGIIKNLITFKNEHNDFKGTPLSNEFIADIFTPRAITVLEDSINFDFNKIKQRQAGDMPNEVLLKIMNLYGILTPEMHTLCGINDDRAKEVSKLIMSNIFKMSQQEILEQKTYLLRDKVLANKLFQVVINPFKPMFAERIDIIKFHDTFVETFLKRIANNRDILSDPERQDKISRWCSDVSKIFPKSYKISARDLSIILTVIIRAASNDKYGADDKLNELRNDFLENGKIYPYLDKLSEIVDNMPSVKKSSRRI